MASPCCRWSGGRLRAQSGDGGSALGGVGVRGGRADAYTIWFKYPFVFHVGAVGFAYIWYRGRSHAPLQTARCARLRARRAAGRRRRDRLSDGPSGRWPALVESARVTSQLYPQGVSDFGAAIKPRLVSLGSSGGCCSSSPGSGWRRRCAAKRESPSFGG